MIVSYQWIMLSRRPFSSEDVYCNRLWPTIWSLRDYFSHDFLSRKCTTHKWRLIRETAHCSCSNFSPTVIIGIHTRVVRETICGCKALNWQESFRAKNPVFNPDSCCRWVLARGGEGGWFRFLSSYREFGIWGPPPSPHQNWNFSWKSPHCIIAQDYRLLHFGAKKREPHTHQANERGITKNHVSAKRSYMHTEKVTTFTFSEKQLQDFS